jgi:hypothetical protein
MRHTRLLQTYRATTLGSLLFLANGALAQPDAPPRPVEESPPAPLPPAPGTPAAPGAPPAAGAPGAVIPPLPPAPAAPAANQYPPAPETVTAPADGAAAPAEPSAAPEAGVTSGDLEGLRYDIQGITSDLENFKFQWQRERDIHTALTTRGIRIGGTIQTRFGWTDLETTAPASPTVYHRKSSFDIGAALITFTGSLYKDYAEGRNLDFALRYGASPQQASNNSFLNVLDANVVYSPVSTIDREDPQLTITLGQQLLPFGLEVPATEELKPVIRNALFTTRLNLARRDVGLIVRGDLFPMVDFGYNYRVPIVQYAFGLVNGAGPNTLDDNNVRDVIGRVALTVPSDFHSWLRQITLGATGYFGSQNTFLADGPPRTIAGRGTKRRLGVDFYYNHWPFGVTYEFIRGTDVATPGTTLADPRRRNIDSEAHTVTVFLSFGEQFVSGFRNQGRYDDWWPKTYQPFLRYDRYDPNKDAKNDVLNVVTLGANLFVAETTKFQLNLNWEDDEGKKVQKEILAQAQVGF